MSERVTVTELNTRVKEVLSSNRDLNDIWVLGEISNLKRYTSGHYYLTIKDPGSEIRAVMFCNSRSRIDFEPADSMKVEAYGHVDMYVERGSYQFIVDSMKRSGVGELYLRYEALRKKLEAEGLFSQDRKRKLPVYPKTIGVVTSPTGAVIHDIITTTGRLYPADILLAPAQVQGEGAWKTIVAGIDLLNRVGVDVIIVGRGGGSIEDLWPFNEEPVARAIAASRVPVISSVGHETDFTIADFVADVRAATPTAAAQLAVRDKGEIRRQLEEMMARANKALSASTERMRARFDNLDSKMSLKKAKDRIDYLLIKLDDMSLKMAAALSNKNAAMHRRLSSADARLVPALMDAVSRRMKSSEGTFIRLDPAMRVLLGSKMARLEKASASLAALSPYAVLERGYSFVAGPDGRAVTSVRGLSKGSVITVRMHDGRVEAEIKDMEEFQ